MLSQTTEYALRAMACLAGHPDDLTPTPELARRTAVPANYLAKVLQSLAQSDLIRGRRGVGGGYRLAKPAEEISLLDIVNAISPMDRPDALSFIGNVVGRAQLEALQRRLTAATDQVKQHLGGVTLRDLLDDPGVSEPAMSGRFAHAGELSTATVMSGRMSHAAAGHASVSHGNGGYAISGGHGQHNGHQNGHSTAYTGGHATNGDTMNGHGGASGAGHYAR